MSVCMKRERTEAGDFEGRLPGAAHDVPTNAAERSEGPRVRRSLGGVIRSRDHPHQALTTPRGWLGGLGRVWRLRGTR